MRLRAMISSTISGLEAHRAIASETLESMGFETVRSEQTGSVADPPQKWCEAAAEKCDLFVLLLGPRYGWIIPGEGISVVEYEFNVATGANRNKVLVFLRDPGENRIEARQADFIERVCDFKQGHFRATPYRGAEDLALRLKSDAMQWLRERLREARFSPEGIALLTARRPLRGRVLDMWLIFLGVAIAVASIGSVHPFYRKFIHWRDDLSPERIAWLLSEAGSTLAKAVSCVILGVGLALGLSILLLRLAGAGMAMCTRFLSGLLVGAILPVSLVGPILFGYGQWQVILLGMLLVCGMSLSRFAALVTELDATQAVELLISFLAARDWVPSFLAVSTYVTFYCGFFLGGGLLEVWIMANHQSQEGVKFAAVVLFVGGLWTVVGIAGVALRSVARLLLLRRIAITGA